jgi:hypothetical protein
MTDKRVTIEFVDMQGNRGQFACAAIVAIDGKAFTDQDDRMELTERMTYQEARLDTIEKTLLMLMTPAEGDDEGA